MFLKIVTAGLLLIGLLMSGFGIYFIALGYEAEGWTEVEGRVVSVSVRVDTDLSSSQASRTRREELRRYYPSIRYVWVVEGKGYSGSRYRLGETHEKYDERAEAQAAAARFPAGSPVTVYFDKDHPDQAVLDPSLSMGVFVPLPLGLLFLLLRWLLYRHRQAIEKAMQEAGESS